MTIYKYPLQIVVPNAVDMPADARIVHVDVQGGTACMWVLLDPHAQVTSRVFCIAGTGHSVPESWLYLGSWQEPPFVWHLFETTP